MLSILYIIVNYNSADDTLRYLKSIKKSQQNIEQLKLDIILVDNSTNKSLKLRKSLSLLDLNLKIIDSGNVGYFGAFKVALERVGYVRILQYDHVIISNVDLQLPRDFFIKLSEIKFGTEIGALAPSILSICRNNDLNPKIDKKPKKTKIILNIILFKFPFLFKLYAKLSELKTKHKKISNGSRIIYAPHGSFIIFNKIFFNRGAIIDYPVFLFGEEMYVAEIMRQVNLKILYTPAIKIFDFDHGATSKENSSFIATEHRKALVYILKKYY